MARPTDEPIQPTPTVAKMDLYELRPTDLVVLHYDGIPSEMTEHRIRRMFPHIRSEQLVVLPKGLTITVIRQS
jgi:hypothetical protein